MSDAVQTALIAGLCTALPPLLLGIITLLKLKKVEHATNSLTENLVKTTGESERAKGKQEGKAEEKAEVALKAEGAKEQQAADGAKGQGATRTND